MQFEMEEMVYALNMIRSAMTLWCVDKSKPFGECVKTVCIGLEDDRRVKMAIGYAWMLLMKQNLVLSKDYVKNARSNYTYTQDYLDMKKRILGAEDANIEEYQFFKVLRDCLAHDDLSSPDRKTSYGWENGIVYCGFKAEFACKDGSKKTLDLKISTEDIYGLVCERYLGINNLPDVVNEYEIDERGIELAMCFGRLDFSKLDNYFEIKNEPGNLDPYQIDAIKNYLCQGQFLQSSVGKIPRCALDAFALNAPHRNNIQNNLDMSDMLVRMIGTVYNDTGVSCAQYENDIYHMEDVPMESRIRILSFFADPRLVDYAVGSALVFNELTNIDITQGHPELMENIQGVDARVLRNALTHGLYYYSHGTDLQLHAERGSRRVAEHVASVNFYDLCDNIQNIVLGKEEKKAMPHKTLQQLYAEVDGKKGSGKE